jgi:hypothetical protein
MPISPIKFRALKAAERLQLWRFVTGHDFSRADKANRINRDLAPADVYCANLPDIMPFFRSLFSP